MSRPTPQQQARNMYAGIKHVYHHTMRRDVHDFYTWTILAAAIGFIIGAVYTASQLS